MWCIIFVCFYYVVLHIMCHDHIVSLLSSLLILILIYLFAYYLLPKDTWYVPAD